VSEQLQEALSLIKTDVKCLEDAARHIEELASKLDPKEKVKWDLVAAVYRERATLHKDMLRTLSGRVTGRNRAPASDTSFVT
jgi:hypothetical protein